MSNQLVHPKIKWFKPKDTSKLEPGNIVRALINLDPIGANVPIGTIGVVFGETNYYKDGCGPIVRWLTERGGCCNVYEGDVEEMDSTGRNYDE